MKVSIGRNLQVRLQRRILISENCGSFLTNDKIKNFEVFLLDHKIENSEEVLMACKIDHSEKIAIDEPTRAELDKVKNSQSHARDATEFEDLVERTRVRTKSRNLGWRHRQWQHQQGQQNQARVAATEHTFEATSVLEYVHDESDQTEAPICVLDDTHRCKWIKEDAMVDSGAVECITSRERVPPLKVEDTPESRRRETWSFAGVKKIRNAESLSTR